MLEEVSKIRVVCNTGPLLSAFQCGRVDLLRHYFQIIYVASSQLAEFEKHGAGDLIGQLIAEGFVVAVELTDEEKARARDMARKIAASPSSPDPDYRNHRPEAEAMVLIGRPELRCRRILLDEKAARAVATELGIEMTGFPGVLGRAGLDGLLTADEIRQLLTMCRQQGTFYSEALIEHVAQTYGR